MKTLVVNIDEELHHAVKVYCVNHRMTVSDLIRFLLKETVEKGETNDGY